jgi:hypothetical protein
MYLGEIIEESGVVKKLLLFVFLKKKKQLLIISIAESRKDKMEGGEKLPAKKIIFTILLCFSSINPDIFSLYI